LFIITFITRIHKFLIVFFANFKFKLTLFLKKTIKPPPSKLVTPGSLNLHPGSIQQLLMDIFFLLHYINLILVFAFERNELPMQLVLLSFLMTLFHLFKITLNSYSFIPFDSPKSYLRYPLNV